MSLCRLVRSAAGGSGDIISQLLCLSNAGQLSYWKHQFSQSRHHASKSAKSCKSPPSPTLDSLQQQFMLLQHVAGLSLGQAGQLLEQEPQLVSFLHQSDNMSLRFALNVQTIRSLGCDFGVDMPARLRAYMALSPPQALEQAAAHGVIQLCSLPRSAAIAELVGQLHKLVVHESQEPSHQEATCHQPASSTQQWQQVGHREQLAQLLHARVMQQERAQLAMHQTQEVVMQPQEQQPYWDIALAVVTALGLPPEQLVDKRRAARRDHDDEEEDEQEEGSSGDSDSCSLSTDGAPSSNGSSSGSSSSSGSCRPPSARPEKQARTTAASYAPTCVHALSDALVRTSRSVSLRSKPILDPKTAGALVTELLAASGLTGQQMLQLLLARPALLWQQQSPESSSKPALHLLLQQLPAFQQQQLLLQLLQKAPVLSTCDEAQLTAVLSLLLGRLGLSADEAAHTLLRHPRLLLAPVRDMSLNLGFLVGLGLSQPELAAMAVKSPAWLTRPLQELTMQWQFVSTVIKCGPADVVLFPDLLSLPISSRLGPRTLYARKRQVKLLLPSHAAMLPGLPQQQWLKHKLVPLDFWLSATEQRICQVVGMPLDDYKRFKAAWKRINAAGWQSSNPNVNSTALLHI